MKAVGFQQPGPIERLDALQDITLEKPVAHGRDLLVEIKAVSVNPVDTKVRVNRQPQPDSWEILGYDAVGVVKQLGQQLSTSKKEMKFSSRVSSTALGPIANSIW